FRASSDAHDLRMSFRREGVSLGFGADHVELSLRAVGYAQRLRPVSAAAPTGRYNRVEYPRGSLIEWYVNGPVGLEQGFTLQGPPPRADGPLTLALSISGTLTATVAEGGRELLLSRGGIPKLRYRGLTAADASGRELPASLELS